MTCHLRVGRFFSSILLATTFAAHAVDPHPAEYAIRWDPADGGPKSAAETWAKLELADGDKDTFNIWYSTVSAPPNLPNGFKAIVRERQKTNKKKYELTYKHRGQVPLPATPSLAQWTCPVGATDEKKDEVDVSFYGLTNVVHAYSRSCTVESKDAPPVIPKALKTKRADCKSTVTRLKLEKLTVEEWHVPGPGKRTIIEVSQSGADTNVDLGMFRDRIAKKLVEEYKIKPSKSSMTELGSSCGS
ncbi:hypothetical protein [Variovorax sp. WS11]|uniref:hypothetical protein n=1 Tax=Variovorax sp. WS11 TaxID=1105204 RepID=UPI0011B1ECF1|nr:hypothetical protein [Variovorax sp. WS11]NDZ17806.1 hypothetical protein [Variovorax sp. WS11]